MNPRLNFTITDEMAATLRRLCEDKNMRISTAARVAIAEFLRKNGYPVENVHPPWGGSRSEE